MRRPSGARSAESASRAGSSEKLPCESAASARSASARSSARTSRRSRPSARAARCVWRPAGWPGGAKVSSRSHSPSMSTVESSISPESKAAPAQTCWPSTRSKWAVAGSVGVTSSVGALAPAMSSSAGCGRIICAPSISTRVVLLDSAGKVRAVADQQDRDAGLPREPVHGAARSGVGASLRTSNCSAPARIAWRA